MKKTLMLYNISFFPGFLSKIRFFSCAIQEFYISRTFKTNLRWKHYLWLICSQTYLISHSGSQAGITWLKNVKSNLWPGAYWIDALSVSHSLYVRQYQKCKCKNAENESSSSFKHYSDLQYCWQLQQDTDTHTYCIYSTHKHTYSAAPIRSDQDKPFQQPLFI